MRQRAAWLGQVVTALLLGAGTVSAQSLELRDSTIRVNGVDLYFRIGGAGEPIVLLHGFTQTGEQWRGAFTELVKTHRVIVPDLRGHGRSTNPAGVYTHRQVALDIYALLDSLRIQQFHAMGNSSGGMTLLHMATQQPSRVRAMVLVSTTTHFPDQARRIMDASTVESLTAEQWTELRSRHVRGDDQIRMLREQFRGFKDSYDDMNFTRDRLAAITASTLIIHGDRDQFFPVEIAVDMYRGIPRSELFVVPNTSHAVLPNRAVPVLPRVLAFIVARR